MALGSSLSSLSVTETPINDGEKSKWHHITIELTSETIQNFSLLLSEKTELGFYTASQSTIYLSNITLS